LTHSCRFASGSGLGENALFPGRRKEARVLLTLQNRRIGDVIVVSCGGRLVAGDESTILQKHLAPLLPDDPFIILNLRDATYIDSGGVGLLVRMLNRARTSGGDLKLCEVPERIREVLRITRLDTVFDQYDSEARAIAGFLHRTAPVSRSSAMDADVLCVEQSPDVLAYVSTILRQAGYAVITMDNLPDALVLLKGSRPRVVVIGADLRAATGTWTADTFNALARAGAMVELPADFSRGDAAEAGSRLLDQVRAALGVTRAAT
jgi:anti-sigma B factor antagonist